LAAKKAFIVVTNFFLFSPLCTETKRLELDAAKESTIDVAAGEVRLNNTIDGVVEKKKDAVLKWKV
jgi:hypothetical protein